MENMKALHQMTSSALRFVQDAREYAKKRGYILLREEPMIDWGKTPKGQYETMTFTQSIYVANSDIELTVTGYISNEEAEEMTVETTFDFLLGKSCAINQIHDWLKHIRDERTHHFYVTIKGSQEEGFCEDEFSVVIRKRHRLGEDDTFTQWDSLIQLIQRGQNDAPQFMTLDPSVGPKT